MTFRLLFDGRHFRSISLEKCMAVFCVDFAANCTIVTTNMSIQYMGGGEKWTGNGAHVFNRECAPLFNPIDGACNIGFRFA